MIFGEKLRRFSQRHFVRAQLFNLLDAPHRYNYGFTFCKNCFVLNMIYHWSNVLILRIFMFLTNLNNYLLTFENSFNMI